MGRFKASYLLVSGEGLVKKFPGKSSLSYSTGNGGVSVDYYNTQA